MKYYASFFTTQKKVQEDFIGKKNLPDENQQEIQIYPCKKFQDWITHFIDEKITKCEAFYVNFPPF